MIHEDLRFIHEDVERLEQAVADRILDDPKHIKSRLRRDHEISNFLERIQRQSQKALNIYNHDQEVCTRELQLIGTGDPFQSFYEELAKIKDFHKRYPNEPIENLEKVYKKIEHGGQAGGYAGDIEAMFTGEEALGRSFDLIMLHEQYLNLPGIKGVRKPTYLQYLGQFDNFTPPQCMISRKDKMTDQYFGYLGALSEYLQSFLQRVRPLEALDPLFKSFDEEFDKAWGEGFVEGWKAEDSPERNSASSLPVPEGTGEGTWCAACQKEFKNENVYRGHLSGKKHINNAQLQKGDQTSDKITANGSTSSAEENAIRRLKERAVAQREHRIRKLAGAMQTEREDTRVNVERKQGMTYKEREQELAALIAEDDEVVHAAKPDANEDDEEGGEKVYNPLKLPLAWDGKPIPFWLYKLHGLGVEFACEICGNYVYMGRRAFDKHFGEARHVYGLQCLGITRQTGLFREITKIEEAEKLWEKLERDRATNEERKGGADGAAVIEMEDHEGNVMPKVVYDDLLKAGML